MLYLRASKFVTVKRSCAVSTLLYINTSHIVPVKLVEPGPAPMKMFARVPSLTGAYVLVEFVSAVEDELR